MRQTLRAIVVVAGAALGFAGSAGGQPNGGSYRQALEALEPSATAEWASVIEPSSVQSWALAATDSELERRTVERFAAAAQLSGVSIALTDELSSATTFNQWMWRPDVNQLDPNMMAWTTPPVAQDPASTIWADGYGDYVSQATENAILNAIDTSYMNTYRTAQIAPDRMAEGFPGFAQDYSDLTTAIVRRIAEDYSLGYRPDQIDLPSGITPMEKERLGAMTIQAAMVSGQLTERLRAYESRSEPLSLEEEREVFEALRAGNQLNRDLLEMGCGQCMQFSPPVGSAIFLPVAFPPLAVGAVPPAGDLEALVVNFTLHDALISACAAPAGQVRLDCVDLADRSTIDAVMRLNNTDGGLCSAVRIERGVALTAGHCCPQPGDSLSIRLNPVAQDPIYRDFVVTRAVFENPDPDSGANAFVQRCEAYRKGSPPEALPRCAPDDPGCAPLIPGYDLAAVFYEEKEALDLPPVRLLAEDPAIGAPMTLAGYGDDGQGNVGLLRAEAGMRLRRCEGVSSCVLTREFEVGGCNQIDSTKGDSGGLAAVQNKSFEHLFYGLVSRERHYTGCPSGGLLGPGGVYTRLTRNRVKRLSGVTLEEKVYEPPSSLDATCNFLQELYPSLLERAIQVAIHMEGDPCQS